MVLFIDLYGLALRVSYSNSDGEKDSCEVVAFEVLDPLEFVAETGCSADSESVKRWLKGAGYPTVLSYARDEQVREDEHEQDERIDRDLRMRRELTEGRR